MHKTSRIALALALSVHSIAFIQADNLTESDSTVQDQSTESAAPVVDLIKAQEEAAKEAKKRAAEEILKKKHHKALKKSKKREEIYNTFKNNDSVKLSGVLAAYKQPGKELNKVADYVTYEKNDIQIGKIIRNASKEYIKADKKRKEKIQKIMSSNVDPKEILYQLTSLKGGEATHYLMSQPQSVTLARQTSHYATYEKNDPEAGKILEAIAAKLEIKYQSMREERFSNSIIATISGACLLLGGGAGWFIKKTLG